MPAGVDLTADGYADVLWRNNASTNLMWYGNATGFSSCFLPAMPSGYALAWGAVS
jgi:hypothetical protein